MNYSCFQEWSKYFVQNAKFNPNQFSTLIYDGHITHTMHLDALKYLNTNKTFAVCIPAHSSLLFNVGDVTVFSKLKGSFRRIQTDYIREKGRKLLLSDFPYLFKKAWDEIIKQGSIISGKLVRKFLVIYISFQEYRDISFESILDIRSSKS